MSGRALVLIIGLLIGLSGCGDRAYLDPLMEVPINDQYVADDGSLVGTASYAHSSLISPTTPGRDYYLDSGDRVRIEVFGQPNMSRVYSVDGGGFISMPLIGGIKTKGLTTFQLARKISARLSARYFNDPKVNVEINTYRPFFILGEVRNPGRFPYVNGMTVRTAVAIAGGYTPRAYERFVNLTRTIDGQVFTQKVPFNYPLMPGDTIYVTERFL